MNNATTAALRPIIAGGLLAGTVDIGSASLINWVSPVLILHYVASGLLGNKAFTVGCRK